MAIVMMKMMTVIMVVMLMMGGDCDDNAEGDVVTDGDCDHDHDEW